MWLERSARGFGAASRRESALSTNSKSAIANEDEREVSDDTKSLTYILECFIQFGRLTSFVTTKLTCLPLASSF